MELWELRQKQSLPLEAKILMSQQRIRQWYEHWDGQVYVSFSGGKDSTVLLHLVRQMYPDVPAVFADTGLEYPEIREFVKTVENVEWVKPGLHFRQAVEKHGFPVVSKEIASTVEGARRNQKSLRYKKLFGSLLHDGKKSPYNCTKWNFLYKAPFKISDKCCGVMKKTPFKKYEKTTGRKGYIGTMATDSVLRQTNYMRHGCNSFGGRGISLPLSFWTEQDIWDYIHQFNVPYSKIYDMGYTRTGCMFCMFGVHLEQEPNRFQRMKHTHPKQWEYCMFKLGLAEVLDYINVPWGGQMELLDYMEAQHE